MQIRRAGKSDVGALTAAFRSEYGRTHLDDILDEAKLFLVAWVDADPVGHAFVNWPGPRQAEPFAAFPDCPEIHRLAVLESHRRRGIAAALIAACETEAGNRGYRHIGMGTDPSVPVANNLYYRLGYEDSGIGLFDDRYKVLDPRGNVVDVAEPTRFLIKQLEI